MTWRRLGVLVHYLPADAATVRAVGGPQFEWSTSDYLLASVVDAVRAGNWQRGGKRNAPKPQPLPRPGDSRGRQMGGKRKFSTAQMDRLMSSWTDERPGRTTTVEQVA